MPPPTLDYRRPPAAPSPRFSWLAGFAFGLAAFSCPQFTMLVLHAVTVSPRTRHQVWPVVPVLVLIALAVAVTAEYRIRRSRGSLTGHAAAQTAIALCVAWMGLLGFVALFLWRMSSFG